MDIPRIRVVRDDVKVWLVYAGYRRRYFEQFRGSRRIFLELPGFDANAATFQSANEIGRRLAMSRAIRRWIMQQDGPRPTSSLSAYVPEQYPSGSTDARALTAELGNIQRMFVDARPGDIVISPPMGHYNRMLIGEIVGRFSPDDTLEIPYLGGEKVPTRRVRWLATNATRRSFSSSLARSLQNQHAISQVDEAFTEEVLRLAYPSFSWREKSKIDVFGTNYTGEDPTQLNSTATLLKYCAAAVIAIERDELKRFHSLSYKDAIKDFYDHAEIDHFRVNFNSPGKFEAIIKARSASALMSALLAFALNQKGSSSGADAIGDAVTGALDGAGAQPIKNDVDRLVASLRDDQWGELCKLGNEASDDLSVELTPRADEAGEE